MSSSRLTGHMGSFAAAAPAVFGLIVLTTAGEQEYATMAWGSLLVVAGCWWLLAYRWGSDATRPPLLYLILFSFFHFGLIWTLGLFGESGVASISATALFWVRTPFLQLAVSTAAAGLIAFTVTSAALARPGHERIPPRLERNQRLLTLRLARLGVAMQLAALVILFLTIVRLGGLSILSGGYLTFLESAQDASVAYSIWAVGLGSALSQIGPTRERRVGLAIFALFALLFFPLGLRGSVLFPAAAVLAVRSKLGHRAPAMALAGGALAALVLSSIVRVTRVGREPAGDGGALSGVFSTITELGFSIRPTTEVLRWQDTDPSYSWFISLIAVPLRLIESLTGWHGGAPANDERLFNVKINNLVGPIGGSPIAEGYDAAGLFGVLLVMAAIAAALSFVTRRTCTTAIHLALFPVVALPLVISVRNSFAPVLPQMLLGLLTVFLATRLGAAGHQPHPRDAVTAPHAR